MVYFMPCHSLSRASVNLKVTGAFFNSRESNTLIRMTACGKTIAVAGVDRAEHLALILRRLWRERSWHLHLTRRLLRHAYFKKVSQCLLNRAQVLLHHLLAFLPVGVTNGLTYGFDRFIARQNFRDGKETSCMMVFTRDPIPVSRVLRITALSITMQFSPMVIGAPSATIHAPNIMRVPRPIETFPQIVAFGATYAELSISGMLPSCSMSICTSCSSEGRQKSLDNQPFRRIGLPGTLFCSAVRDSASLTQ